MPSVKILADFTRLVARPHDNIKNGRIDANYAAFVYDIMTINWEDYEKFRLEVDDIPEKYDELVILLNEQYNVAGNYLEALTRLLGF